MLITKQQLIGTIHKISEKIDKLNIKLVNQEKKIKELELHNQALNKNHQNTLNQIKEYIKELEKIRNHYVDNNNNTG